MPVMMPQKPSTITRHWQDHFFYISGLFLLAGSTLLLAVNTQYASSFTLGFLVHYIPCWIAAQCTFLHTGAAHKNRIVQWFFCGEILKLLTYTGFSLLILWFFDIDICMFFGGMALSIGTFLWVPLLIDQFKSR